MSTDLPATFRCDCCGRAVPFEQSRECDAFCLDCEYRLLQSTLDAADATADVIRAAVRAALPNIAPADLLSAVVEVILQHAQEGESTVPTMAETLRTSSVNRARMREAI